jgi:hypothetical protein
MAAMWMAWLSRRLPLRFTQWTGPPALPLSSGRAVVAGELVPVPNAGHVTDLAEDRGGDDRPDPVDAR